MEEQPGYMAKAANLSCTHTLDTPEVFAMDINEASASSLAKHGISRWKRTLPNRDGIPPGTTRITLQQRNLLHAIIQTGSF